MNRTRAILLAVIILLSVPIAAYLLTPRHQSVGTKNDAYYIEAEFERVRKIMVRTNSFEKIVSSQHGKVLHQEWSDLSFQSEKLFSNWNIDGLGIFVVQTSDPYEGSLILRFNQEVSVEKESLVSTARLAEPVGHLKGYTTHISMTPEGGRTRVDSSVSLRYERKVPRRYQEFMDSKVQQAAEENWQRGRDAVIGLVEQYRDARFIVPLKD